MSIVCCEMIDVLTEHLDSLKKDLEGDLLLENAAVRITVIPDVLTKIQASTDKVFLTEYNEYFESIKTFYKNCSNVLFLNNNLQQTYDSIVLLSTCLKHIKEMLEATKGQCICCGSEVNYIPFSDLESEIISKEKNICPVCRSCDRDRLIVAYLKKIGLPVASEGIRVLQIAPTPVIDRWIKKWCPNIYYNTTDFFGVTFKSRIQDINNDENNIYDVVICSHVLECVQDYREVMSVMKRILKDDGELIFLASTNLTLKTIDEERELSEDVNWSSFGRDDYRDTYSKQESIERLRECYYVNQFGKDYFGEELFRNAGLTDTNTLYVMTKNEKVDLYKGWIPTIDKELCENGPLVSVILPCFNHEKYVARTIESIINQSYKNIELIVCDDGSTDDTPTIMKKYSDHFAKEYYFTENLRVRVPFLAEQATGKYIALAHSDDYWEKDKLALQVAYLEKNGGISLTWAEYIDDSGKTQDSAVFYKKNRNRVEWLRYFWEEGSCLCNPSSVMKRELFLKERKHGFASKQLPDYFKWIDLVQENDIYIVPLPLTKMGVHYSGKILNDSAPTKANLARSLLEDGIHWLYVLEDMNDELFVEVFARYFKNKNACSKEELMCERFFLMRDSHSIARANSSIYYLSRHYPELHDCLLSKYGYRKEDFFNDELQKGFLSAIE